MGGELFVVRGRGQELFETRTAGVVGKWAGDSEYDGQQARLQGVAARRGLHFPRTAGRQGDVLDDRYCLVSCGRRASFLCVGPKEGRRISACPRCCGVCVDLLFRPGLLVCGVVIYFAANLGSRCFRQGSGCLLRVVCNRGGTGGPFRCGIPCGSCPRLRCVVRIARTRACIRRPGGARANGYGKGY